MGNIFLTTVLEISLGTQVCSKRNKSKYKQAVDQTEKLLHRKCKGHSTEWKEIFTSLISRNAKYTKPTIYTELDNNKKPSN